jgi:hypothetical protein
MVDHHPHDKLIAALDHHVSHVGKIKLAANEAAAEHQLELNQQQERLKAEQS